MRDLLYNRFKVKIFSEQKAGLSRVVLWQLGINNAIGLIYKKSLYFYKNYGNRI